METSTAIVETQISNQEIIKSFNKFNKSKLQIFNELQEKKQNFDFTIKNDLHFDLYLYSLAAKNDENLILEGKIGVGEQRMFKSIFFKNWVLMLDNNNDDNVSKVNFELGSTPFKKSKIRVKASLLFNEQKQ